MRTGKTLLLVLLLSGCDDSKNPLSDPQGSKPDERLAGVWRARDKEGEVAYWHIGRAGDKLPQSVMRVLGVTHKQNGIVRPEGEMLIFPTTLGNSTYLNVTDGREQRIKLLEEKGWNPEVLETYYLLKYKIEGDTLLLWLMDGDAKEQAIEAGKVKGVIERKKLITRIRFTDTTENLARFVAGAGDGLFSKEVLRLERVK